MRIGVCLPSRGYVYSRTMEDILRNTQKRTDIEFFFSHGRGIPDSANFITENALDAGVDYIWFVEDDQKLPADILEQMLALDEDVVICDYPIGRFGKCVKVYPNGTIRAGLGCTLIKASVFEKLKRPYFSADYEFGVTQEGIQPMEMNPDRDKTKVHGNHDLIFYYRLWEAKVKFVVHHTPVGHYFFITPKLPKSGNKTGEAYVCEVWEYDNIRIIDSNGNTFDGPIITEEYSIENPVYT